MNEISLDKFLENDDPNKWWRLSTGEMQSLFDQAMDVICEKDKIIDSLNRNKL